MVPPGELMGTPGGGLAALERGEVLAHIEGRYGVAVGEPHGGVFKEAEVGADRAVRELAFAALIVVASSIAARKIRCA